MNRICASRRLCWLIGILLSVPGALADDRPRVAFVREGDQLRIDVGGEPMATYVLRDETVLRPYFAQVHAPGGARVTRRFPPVEGKDPTDHATMHPGLWMAFGDINGVDFWRNKGRVEHERFVVTPAGGAGKGTFTVRNLYLSGPAATPVCVETCRVTILARAAGTLLILDSGFVSDDHDLAFGAQEEMGLGVRVATPIAVKQGGWLLDSEGRKGEREVWGKHAEWCDAGGTIGGRDVGVTLMPDPASFGRGWFHARDYGLLVANPIERSERKQGEPARLVVRRGEPLRLRFGVLIHVGTIANTTATANVVDLKAAYQDFLREIADSRLGVPSTP